MDAEVCGAKYEVGWVLRMYCSIRSHVSPSSWEAVDGNKEEGEESDAGGGETSKWVRSSEFCVWVRLSVSTVSGWVAGRVGSEEG